MEGQTVFHNVPNQLLDSRTTVALLRGAGVSVDFLGDRLSLVSDKYDVGAISHELVQKTRYSTLLLGVSKAREQCVDMPTPGGCKLNRSVDIHIDGLRALGATIVEEAGLIRFKPGKRSGARFTLRSPSVGATLNLILASVLGESEVELANIAIEPEIVDFVSMLRSAGARIDWTGERRLVVNGVSALSGIEWRIIPDRIVAVTYVIAAAMNERGILLRGIEPAHIALPLAVLRDIGLDIHTTSTTLRLYPTSLGRLLPFVIEARPYPGFPTDLQPIMTALAACISGTSHISESVFDTRFQYVPYLNRIGSDIQVADRLATVNGKRPGRAELHDVDCTDIRGGMSAVLFAMAGGANVNIAGFQEIERGYAQPQALFESFGYTLERTGD
ncbi:MAG TPA: UDP-N-acetylglucosamine 1-carboxyvinyltransferase [Rhizomicrobium sp.]|nr:UDP-N-acetylglucosamine 1-carboxyvinyltransferase [Rhizomicrobium sp.]